MYPKMKTQLSLLSLFLVFGTHAVEAGCGNTVRGTRGPDRIDGSFDPPTTDCPDFVFASDGDDVVHGLGGNDGIQGEAGRDELFGDRGDDSLNGGGENDVLHGGEGADRLDGGSDDDQLYGGPGEDTLFGLSGRDYLDGEEGEDALDGGTDDDVLVARSLMGSLRGGSGDDFLVIVGDRIGDLALEGDTGGGNTFDDLLFFARDAAPEMVTPISLGEKTYLQLSFDLRTPNPVQVDLARAPRVEAVVTGDGSDHVIGTNAQNRFAYFARFQAAGTPLSVHELFFTGAGDDRIETLAGDDYVDSGTGDDTLTLGNGAHYLLTGPGRDLLLWRVEALGHSKPSRVTDLSPEDRIHILGSIAPTAVSFSTANEGGHGTWVEVNGNTEILLLGVQTSQATVQAIRGGVEIRVQSSLPVRGAASPSLLTK